MATQLKLFNEDESQEKKEAKRKARKKAYQKAYNKKNKKRLNAQCRLYYHTKVDKKKTRKRRRERYRKHPEVRKQIREHKAKLMKKYRENPVFIAKTKAYFKEYLQRPGVKERRNKRLAEKGKTDPKYRLTRNIRQAIGRSIKSGKNERCFKKLIPYTIEKLKKHLEKLFQPGMSWDNYGSEWHVDHKIPLSVFNYTKPEHRDFNKAWALTNLQPLWAEDNLKKNANLTKHFQPSLRIAV